MQPLRVPHLFMAALFQQLFFALGRSELLHPALFLAWGLLLPPPARARGTSLSPSHSLHGMARRGHWATVLISAQCVWLS